MDIVKADTYQAGVIYIYLKMVLTYLERWSTGNLIDLGSRRCVMSISRDAGLCPNSEADWQNCTDGIRHWVGAGKIIEPIIMAKISTSHSFYQLSILVYCIDQFLSLVNTTCE